ncbi:hypothetical protein GGR57DRAFT_361092 [Xylariaceae sp. FL1272]|nr:hypothetical protein GGR57DRAFT_361092 [Xylariaceae sp. FL1272]
MPPVTSKNRVCDRCIRKKVKCDLQRPHCSRCLEAGLECMYSAERRRPGPPRGSKRQKPVTPAESISNEAQVVTGDRSDVPPRLQTDVEEAHSMMGSEVIPPTSLQNFGTSHSELQDFENYDLSYPSVPSSGPHDYPGYTLTGEQARELIVHFFAEVHPAIPLFRVAHFLKQYDEGIADRTLFITMITVTAKILGPINFWKADDLESCMSYLLQLTSLDTNFLSTQFSLDTFRFECLLAYYEFHQFPGSSSWTRISNLCRKLYSVGVNQIDSSRDLCSAFDASLASEDDVEDWRYLFWCMYCLDTYANFTFGTPFVIELESINTSLVRRSAQGTDNLALVSNAKIFLPDEIDDIWKTAKDVVSHTSTANFNIHLITTVSPIHLDSKT